MLEPIEASFCLADPADSRYQYMVSLKQRFGKFLHEASVSLRGQGEENTVDAVLMLVSLHHACYVKLTICFSRSGLYELICWNTEIAGIGEKPKIESLPC